MEIIKIRAEINKIESKKIQKINKCKSWPFVIMLSPLPGKYIKRWFCEKINKIDKPLTTLINKKRERTHINKIRKRRKNN